MTIGVLVFALVAALLIGVLGALLFTAFCVGVALLILLPTLFITTFAAAFIWLWGVGAYYILKWFNEKDIPGVTSSLGSITGDDGEKSSGEDPSAPNGDDKGQNPQRKKNEHDTEKKSEKKSNGVAGLPGTEKVDDVTKSTGLDKGPVGDIKKKADVGNLTKNADVGNLTKKADVGNLKNSVPGGVLG